MMLRLTAFSQQDTDTIHIKCFPERVVKSIVKDLIKGDSAIAEIKMLDTELLLTQEKVNIKDSIISDLKLKDIKNNEIISYEREQKTIYKKNIERLEADLKRSKRINRAVAFFGTPIICTLLVITLGGI